MGENICHNHPSKDRIPVTHPRERLQIPLIPLSSLQLHLLFRLSLHSLVDLGLDCLFGVQLGNAPATAAESSIAEPSQRVKGKEDD